MASSDVVTFRGGFVADWTLVRRLLDIEARGATFHLESEGRFRVVPSSVLTPDDITVLRARRDEARAVLIYSDEIAQQPI
jgi:hypothetical protein